MSMDTWARKEIELAITAEKEASNYNKDEWEYGVKCYESALKAFDCLLNDEHSGASIKFTKSILNRLIDGKCLTPIEDTKDIWGLLSDRNGVREYQCKRMSSLFKTEKESGEVIYTDIDRIVCIDINNPGTTYHSGFAARFLNKLVPITMPYLPDLRPFRLFEESFLYDKNAGDFDTMAFLYIIAPNGAKMDIYKYFKEDENKKLVSISKEEYEKRKEKFLKDIKNNIKS